MHRLLEKKEQKRLFGSRLSRFDTDAAEQLLGIRSPNAVGLELVWPDFTALPGRNVGPQHTGGVMITPSLDYMERAWDEAKYGRPSSRPFTHFIIQSATDPSLLARYQEEAARSFRRLDPRLAFEDAQAARRRPPPVSLNDNVRGELLRPCANIAA